MVLTLQYYPELECSRDNPLVIYEFYIQPNNALLNIISIVIIQYYVTLFDMILSITSIVITYITAERPE